ncbi:MAG: methyltransferase domain-containing protein [Deltaproteobacteria bacterium]|nr:methyltransferase domain-containing protein [Deltaproteobacteria bacterium]MCB9480141.1 methyltransferase domain-containing protein [Deltaproteobacteria bacterium]MCB9487893.1 methyltransferase domain-containing protein [Deltaproteobacteria bacterium]
MAKDLWTKLKTNPVGLAKNAVVKLVVNPIKYRKGEGYDAERYWRDRFERHGANLTGPGDEGLSEDDNRRMYEEAGQKLLAILADEGVDPAGARVLEIGCGNGFFTGLMHDAGVRDLTGVDITDVQFERFRARWPEFRFHKADITQVAPEGRYDLVLMIDVIQHIVTEDALADAFKHVKSVMAPGAAFVLYPMTDRSRRHMLHVHWWDTDDVRKHFDGHAVGDAIPFRYSNLVVIRKAG